MDVKYFSYRLDHDYGFAPNPFGGYCTLANCMPKIRSNKNLNIGDWIFGVGSKKLKNEFHIIYIMKVKEKLSYIDYWNDERFQFKKPNHNGSLRSIHGDNIYFQNELEEWSQLESLHSKQNGEINYDHLKNDLGGKNVLVSDNFYYFGDNHFLVPEEYKSICCSNPRGFCCHTISKNEAYDFLILIQKNYSIGVHGDPINWIDYKQRTLFT